MPPAKATFSIEGQSAQAVIGRHGFFEGTYTAVLDFIRQKGITTENIIGSIGYNSTNQAYFLFYWK